MFALDYDKTNKDKDSKYACALCCYHFTYTKQSHNLD